MPKVKKIELSFVCDEDWNKMSPVENGRHCASCAKTVVNFMGMSDAQIVAYYSQKKNEKSCGQFRNGQLEHINKGLSRPAIKESKSWFKPILASALLASFGCETQTNKEVTKTEVTTDDADSGDVDLIGKICVDTTNRETSKVKTDFQPRKITQVKSLDTTKRKIQTLDAVHINEIIPSPEERDYQLGGIPAISYDETVRGELNMKGNITLEKDSVSTKVPWHQRIFRRK